MIVIKSRKQAKRYGEKKIPSKVSFGLVNLDNPIVQKRATNVRAICGMITWPILSS